MENWKSAAAVAAGLIGGTISEIFGGWTQSMTTLLIFMSIDYITGLLVAGVFHASPKSETGSLESRAGWKGLVRKGVTLLIVLIASRIDMELGVEFAKEGCVYGFMLIEGVSILENAGLMGVKYPAFLTKALDTLAKKQDTDIVDPADDNID